MHLNISPAGKLAILMTFFSTLLLISWTIVVITSTKSYSESTSSKVVQYHYGQHMDKDKLPRLSADKKTLVVTNEEALPNAFEFIRLNMYLPIKKIVLMKQGVNDTVRVYPIARDGLVGLVEGKLTVNLTEVGLVLLFLIFIVGSFAYIFLSMSGTRGVWEDEAWSTSEDFESEGDEKENEKLIKKAEEKRKDIEMI